MAPHIVSVSFEGVRSEVLLHALEDQEIYVSAGSACSSNKPAISATLKSIGIKKELLESTIRFSFGAYNDGGYSRSAKCDPNIASNASQILEKEIDCKRSGMKNKKERLGVIYDISGIFN